MSTLREHLAQKREAYRALKAKAAGPDAGPRTIAATARVEGRSGVRRIRIRDFQVISDSGPEFAGHDLGPSSPELQLGVPVDSIDVEIAAELDPRAGKPGFDHIPVHPHNIRYTLHIVSPASAEQIAALHAQVEKVCSILNLLKGAQTITATLDHRRPDEAVAGKAA